MFRYTFIFVFCAILAYSLRALFFSFLDGGNSFLIKNK